MDGCEIPGTQDAPNKEDLVVKSRSLCWLPKLVFLELPIKKSSLSRSPATEAQLGVEGAIGLAASSGGQMLGAGVLLR